MDEQQGSSCRYTSNRRCLAGPMPWQGLPQCWGGCSVRPFRSSSLLSKVCVCFGEAELAFFFWALQYGPFLGGNSCIAFSVLAQWYVCLRGGVTCCMLLPKQDVLRMYWQGEMYCMYTGKETRYACILARRDVLHGYWQRETYCR